MYSKIYLLTIIFALFLQTVPAQENADGKEKENAAALETMAVEILRETSQMIGSLRSPRNRQTAVLQTADALWAMDEQTARALFQAANADLKQAMAQVDSKLNYIQTSANQTFVGNNLQTDAKQEMSRIISARTKLINTISKHDVEMANAIFNETNRMVSNTDFLEGLQRANKNLESLLARRAVENDAAKALEYGREKLGNGVSADIIGLMNTIYVKDPEKGAAFGAEVLKKLKDGGTNDRTHYWLAVRLLSQGSTISDVIIRTKSDKKPMFSESELVGLSDYIADLIINNKNRSQLYISPNILRLIEKYTPQKAAQIKNNNSQKSTAPNNTAITKSVIKARQIEDKAEQQRRTQQINYQRDISKLIQSLANENLTHGEKLEIIGIARTRITSVADKKFRLTNLISLAYFADKAEEKESAQSILSEVETLINQQPKKREDFNDNKILAHAYAQINPDKSFAIAENMAYTMNAIIEGYATYHEFTNNKNAVENDEILIETYSRQFTDFFSFSPAATKNLAETDFQRLKNLPDKFNRIELRIEARLNLANALLKAIKQPNNLANSRSAASGENELVDFLRKLSRQP